MNIKTIKKALLECYSKDLCYYKVKDKWNENNKCLGMCAITSLIINDYFGGDICKIHVDGISHYFNIIDNKVVDLTSSQFNYEINYNDYQIIDRNKMLTKGTKQRYNKLKSKLINKLLSEIDKEVYNCHKCENLVEKFPNDKTVFLGKDNDIVLVGEAPANNGWRKSHQLWKDIMLKQLRILNPKLIITLGEFPTRNLLNFKFGKFSDVVGNIYEVEGFKVLPIYHPSPISPKSYKGNIPIFEKLKESKINGH